MSNSKSKPFQAKIQSVESTFIFFAQVAEHQKYEKRFEEKHFLFEIRENKFCSIIIFV